MARFKLSYRSIQLIAVLPALLLSGCGGGNKAADNNTTPTPSRSTAMTTGGNMSTTHMTSGMTTSHMNGGKMGNSHTGFPTMPGGVTGSTTPAGYTRDKNGRLHDRSTGRFVKEPAVMPDPFGRRRDKKGRFINGQKGPGFMNRQ